MIEGLWDTVDWGEVLSGALVVLVGWVAVSCVKRSLPWMGRAEKAPVRGINFLREFVLARKHTRQRAWRELWANRRRLPLWLLRATLFRWYEADPARDWPYVLRVHVEHPAEEVREHARYLLWEERTIEQLRPRDRYSSSEETYHVALSHPCTDGRWLLMSDLRSHGGTFGCRSAGQVLHVNRGWCSMSDAPMTPVDTVTFRTTN